jgi:hypothetical protein
MIQSFEKALVIYKLNKLYVESPLLPLRKVDALPKWIIIEWELPH